MIAADQNFRPKANKHCATLVNAPLYVKCGCDAKVLYKSFAQHSCEAKTKSKIGHYILCNMCSRKLQTHDPRIWNQHSRGNQHQRKLKIFSDMGISVPVCQPCGGILVDPDIRDVHVESSEHISAVAKVNIVSQFQNFTLGEAN